MIKEVQTEKTNTFVSKASEAVLLFSIGLYIFISDIGRTMLDLELPKWKDTFLIFLITAAMLVRLSSVLIENKDSRKAILRYTGIAILIDAVYIAVYLHNQNSGLIIFALFTLATVCFEYTKVLKVYAAAAAAVFLPTIAMAWIGAADNLVYIRDITIRSAWGIRYPTDLISLLFFLLLAIWAAFKDKNGLWLLIPGSILTLMSLFVADSRTGFMCCLLFIVAVVADHYMPSSGLAKLKKAVKVCMCATFPVLAVIMNALVFAYHRGMGIALRLNGVLSDRLSLSSDALSKYGLSLLGQPIKFTGWGGSTFFKPGYDYVDISYVLILLKFGVITLLMISILWVLMTRRALSTGNRRLAAVLTLIAVNAAAEHHIMTPYYNFCLLMPLAILAAKECEAVDGAETNDPSLNGSFRDIFVKLAVMTGIAVIAGIFILQILPVARTVISIIHTDNTVKGQRMIFAMFIAGMCLAAAGLYSVYKLCIGLARSGERKKYIAPIAALAVVVFTVLIMSNSIINRGAAKTMDVIESERDTIETVISSKTGKLYVSGLPAVYRKEYKGISTSLFDGEELARYRKTTVITDKDTDSPCFFNMGFLYTPISEEHALFTNDESVIRALQGEGKHLTAFYPLDVNVDIKSLAEKNGLEVNDDGSVTLYGEDEKLSNGPRIDLRDGYYTFIFDLSADPKSLLQQDICKLIITYYKGEYTATEEIIGRDRFDKEGNATIEVVCNMPDSENTDISVSPLGNSTVTVNGIRIRKTPIHDVHSFYDDNHRVRREEYYDLNGYPRYGEWGYAARELEYDDNGNIIREIYFNEKNERILNNSGCCEVRRTYDNKNRDIQDDYYGVDGKRIALADGRGITKYSYDDSGNMVEISFFDITDKPVLIKEENRGGYHAIKREFDSYNRLVQEDFLDVDGNITMGYEGYATRKTLYDENGNFLSYELYDLKGNRV